MGRENPADHGQPVLGVRGAKTAGGEPDHQDDHVSNEVVEGDVPQVLPGRGREGAVAGYRDGQRVGEAGGHLGHVVLEDAGEVEDEERVVLEAGDTGQALDDVGQALPQAGQLGHGRRPGLAGGDGARLQGGLEEAVEGGRGGGRPLVQPRQAVPDEPTRHLVDKDKNK